MSVSNIFVTIWSYRASFLFFRLRHFSMIMLSFGSSSAACEKPYATPIATSTTGTVISTTTSGSLMSMGGYGSASSSSLSNTYPASSSSFWTSQSPVSHPWWSSRLEVDFQSIFACSTTFSMLSQFHSSLAQWSRHGSEHNRILGQLGKSITNGNMSKKTIEETRQFRNKYDHQETLFVRIIHIALT